MKLNFKFVVKKSVALDANNHLYPIAFAIVDSENHDSLKYFMSKLKEAIGEVENLAKSEFHAHFDKIKSKDSAITRYLEGMSFDKWSRAYFPGNNKETSEKITTTLALTYEKDLVDMAEKARFLIIYAIGRHEFHVLDGELNSEVDLLNKTCTCGVFQLIDIPCVHSLSGSLKRGVDFYSLCSNYYKIETWRSSYTETIYPTSNKEEWIVPHDIKTMKVRTPAQKKSGCLSKEETR
ncbi:uncharacterized protein LOC133818916 [Humulus lupulus]|uniref:uncharacterized protein LOC133818916 n=1 Tax=Humulus lupulus TaxID=3486 RepID=UPI002B413A62|nr:uncharacterized protein LOC133818916 [Humulus lupulus]